MNKRVVDGYLPAAIKAIKASGIANAAGEIGDNFRAQISSFNAAVMMGSPMAAVAFFSSRGGAATDRTKLMDAIYLLIAGLDEIPVEEQNYRGVLLFQHLQKNEQVGREDILNASLAIKLALNYYKLPEKKAESEANQQHDE